MQEGLPLFPFLATFLQFVLAVQAVIILGHKGLVHVHSLLLGLGVPHVLVEYYIEHELNVLHVIVTHASLEYAKDRGVLAQVVIGRHETCALGVVKGLVH